VQDAPNIVEFAFDPPLELRICYRFTEVVEGNKRVLFDMPLIARDKVNGYTLLEMQEITLQNDDGDARLQESYSFWLDKNGICNELVLLDYFVSPNEIEFFIQLPAKSLNIGQTISYSVVIDEATLNIVATFLGSDRQDGQSLYILRQSVQRCVPEGYAHFDPCSFITTAYYDAEFKLVRKCIVDLPVIDGNSSQLLIETIE